MAQKLTVVVTGSTGKQGGTVARGLLERGHKSAPSPATQTQARLKLLANAGATLVTASLEDTAAIRKALEGVTSLFAMTVPFGGTAAETRQGIAAADAAKDAGVHLVFTSVGSANRQTGIPHFDSKYEVEKHIAKIGARATTSFLHGRERLLAARMSSFSKKRRASFCTSPVGRFHALSTRMDLVDRLEVERGWESGRTERNEIEDFVMAKVIEFYVPKNFRKPLKWAPAPQCGTIIEFCPPTKKSA